MLIFTHSKSWLSGVAGTPRLSESFAKKLGHESGVRGPQHVYAAGRQLIHCLRSRLLLEELRICIFLVPHPCLEKIVCVRTTPQKDLKEKFILV